MTARIAAQPCLGWSGLNFNGLLGDFVSTYSEVLVKSVEVWLSYRLKTVGSRHKNQDFLLVSGCCPPVTLSPFGQLGWNFEGSLGDVVVVCDSYFIQIWCDMAEIRPKKWQKNLSWMLNFSVLWGDCVTSYYSANVYLIYIDSTNWESALRALVPALACGNWSQLATGHTPHHLSLTLAYHLAKVSCQYVGGDREQNYDFIVRRMGIWWPVRPL